MTLEEEWTLSMYVEIRRIMTYGKIAGRGYRLVCHGDVENHREIILSPVTYFVDPLQNSMRSILKTTVLLSPSLFVQTVLDLTVKVKDMEWDIRMIIDLKDWLFYIEDIGEGLCMPDEIKVLIFSSFSIQCQQKTLTLDALAARKHIMSKHYPL